jgi:anaerobic magnesium-protoporphyrin IX monomethyl ester cyclase
MKIILTRPAYSPLYDLISSKTDYKEVSPPFGLLYVAAALEQDGHQVEIIDGELDNLTPANILQKVKDSNPDILGVGATTVDFDYGNLILKEAKEKLGVTTILGGPHATVLADQVLAENPHIDYLVRGEGEITARELVSQLNGNANGNLSQIQGLTYRQDGKIIHNEDRPMIADLNQNVLPARHLIDQRRYLLPVPGKGMRSMTPVQTMRGCPYKCIYCYRMFGHSVRFRDIEPVVDEIEDCLNNHGVESITFIDDTFAINPNRVIQLCEEILRRKLKFPWRCYTRANTITIDILKIMKEAGCKQISIGVESGNQEILDIAGKNIKLEHYIKAYKLLEKTGFEKRGSFILGLPYENARTIRDTIDFAKQLRLDRAFFNICTPYPQTRLFEMAEKREGIRLTSDSWKEFRRWGNAVIELEEVSREQLIDWQKIAMMEFYARPRIIMHHIVEFIRGNHEKFYYRPLFFGLKEFYHRKLKRFFRRPHQKTAIKTLASTQRDTA